MPATFPGKWKVMNRSYRRTVLATLLGVALLNGTALAQHGPASRPGPGGFPPGPGGPHGEFGSPGPPPPRWAPRPEALERLGLTDAQRSKLQALHESNMRTMIRAEAEVRIAELDLDALIQQDSPDAKAIDAAADKVGARRLSMHKAMITEALGVRALLTPEQRSRLRKMGPGMPRDDGQRQGRERR